MRADLERFMENNRWTNPKSPLSYLQCKAIHLNGVQTRLKCKPNVKRCKRFVFPSHSPLLHHNALTTKAISHFQADHILTRFVSPPPYFLTAKRRKRYQNESHSPFIGHRTYETRQPIRFHLSADKYYQLDFLLKRENSPYFCIGNK